MIFRAVVLFRVEEAVRVAGEMLRMRGEACVGCWWRRRNRAESRMSREMGRCMAGWSDGDGGEMKDDVGLASKEL